MKDTIAMSGYTKLFSSILVSTIWREDDKTRIVWITLLALADKNGVAQGSIPGLADLARVSIPDCESALLKLSYPDPYSRTTDHEGRRIAKCDGGWVLLNHGKFRAKMSADERREYNRIKQAEHRQKVSNAVNDIQQMSALSAHAEAEAEAEADTNTKACISARSRFKRPSLETVKLQAAKSGLPDAEAEKFFDHYESNGWHVGKSPMKDWTAAMRKWKTNYDERRYTTQGHPAGSAAKPVQPVKGSARVNNF